MQHSRKAVPIPVDLTHYPDLDLAWIRHSGALKREELRQVFDRLHGKDAPVRNSKLFTDLAEVEALEFGFRELHWHTQRLQEMLRDENRQLLDSVHAPRPVPFGLARIYQQVADPDGPLTVHVNDDRDAALAALDLPDLPRELL